MADAPNELEVLEARREILQLEIALARSAAQLQKLSRKARRLPTKEASPRTRVVPQRVDFPIDCECQRIPGTRSAESSTETDDRLEDLATYVEGELDVERGDDGKPLDPDGDALVHFNELNKKIAEIDSVLERTRNTLTGVLELAAELEDFFVANKGPRTVITIATTGCAGGSVGAAAPPNGHYAPKSFRSGFASAVTAMNVSPDRLSSLTTPPASFLATSSACRRLLVEVPVAPVAPWSSPLANLASRLVTLVSPLRGDT
ncbi:hypothetical protein RI054_31g122760 [Pseudoscourfieldia marina]